MKLNHIMLFCYAIFSIVACSVNSEKVSCNQAPLKQYSKIESGRASEKTTAMIEETFAKNRRKLYEIYDKYNKNNIKITGDTVFSFIVTEGGKALNCRVVESENGCTQLGEDICTAIENMSFKKDIAKGNELVKYPITFFNK